MEFRKSQVLEERFCYRRICVPGCNATVRTVHPRRLKYSEQILDTFMNTRERREVICQKVQFFAENKFYKTQEDSVIADIFLVFIIVHDTE